MSSSSSASSGTSASSRRSGMSPSVGVAAWRTPAKPARRRWTKALLATAAALVLASTLAGAFFLWSIHGDPREATPLTVGRYGYYYGDRAEVRRRLFGSSAMALALVGVSG